MLAAEAEGSRVQIDERRAARSAGALAVQVEQVSATRRAVAQVRDPLDALATEGDRGEQDAGKGGSTSEPSGEFGIYAVTPIGSKAVVQGVLERRARLQPPPSPADARMASPSATQKTGDPVPLWATANPVEAASASRTACGQLIRNPNK
jgi:hypothetical protein